MTNPPCTECGETDYVNRQRAPGICEMCLDLIDRYGDDYRFRRI